MSGGAVIVRRQNRLIQQFRAAGAASPDTAAKPEELGCGMDWVFRRMAAHGVFLDAGGGRYYLDEDRTAWFLRRRAARMVVFTVALILVFILFWTLLPR